MDLNKCNLSIQKNIWHTQAVQSSKHTPGTQLKFSVMTEFISCRQTAWLLQPCMPGCSRPTGSGVTGNRSTGSSSSLDHLWVWPAAQPGIYLINSSTSLLPYICCEAQHGFSIVWCVSLWVRAYYAWVCTVKPEFSGAAFRRIGMISLLSLMEIKHRFKVFNHRSFSAAVFQAIVTYFYKFPGSSETGLKTCQSTKSAYLLAKCCKIL